MSALQGEQHDVQGIFRVLAISWDANSALSFRPRHLQVTHLFRDALHGWGQILLSVNVSPCAKEYDETSHVLKVRPLLVAHVRLVISALQQVLHKS